MSTNSKRNPLVLFIIAVIIIFIIAIVYKNLNVDNSEKITIPEVSKLKTKDNKSKKEYDFTPSADVPITEDPTKDNYSHLSKEERDKKISSNLNKYTMYRTPEQVMETIYQLKDLGREEEAEEYIDFLIKRFPDYEMN